MQEVYLPVMSALNQTQFDGTSDKLIDVLQRMVGSMQVINGLR